MSTVARSMGLFGQAHRRPVDDLVEVLRQPEADPPVVEGPLCEAFGDARDELSSLGVGAAVAQGDEPEHRSPHDPGPVVGDELGLDVSVVPGVTFPGGADAEVTTHVHGVAVPDESTAGA